MHEPELTGYGWTIADDDPLAQLHAGPIFIVGHMRSGTTWALDVLSAHPEVCGLFESLIFTANGLGPLLNPVHWEREERHMEMFGRPMGLGQFLDHDEVLADVRGLCDQWFSRALSPEHHYLVEKAPSGPDSVATVAALYPDATIVHVLRDGRDVAVSTAAARNGWIRPADKQDEPVIHSRHLWGLGRSWASRVSALRQQALTLSIPVHELRYEDMHARPRDAARDLFDFCGIPCDDALLDRILDETQFSRLEDVGERQFRRAGRVGDWREWSRFERLLFEAAAGEVLESTGYAGPPRKQAERLREVMLWVEKAKRFV